MRLDWFPSDTSIDYTNPNHYNQLMGFNTSSFTSLVGTEGRPKQIKSLFLQGCHEILMTKFKDISRIILQFFIFD